MLNHAMRRHSPVDFSFLPYIFQLSSLDWYPNECIRLFIVEEKQLVVEA